MLFGVMHRVEMVEKIGYGIKRMRDLAKEHEIPPPEFDIDENWFTVTFPRVAGETETTGKTTGETVEKTVEKVLALLSANPTITQKELSDKLGLTRRGV